MKNNLKSEAQRKRVKENVWRKVVKLDENASPSGSTEWTWWSYMWYPKAVHCPIAVHDPISGPKDLCRAVDRYTVDSISYVRNFEQLPTQARLR